MLRLGGMRYLQYKKQELKWVTLLLLLKTLLQKPSQASRKLSLWCAGMYPVQADKFGLRTVLEKFQLNDASFVYEPESSCLARFSLWFLAFAS